MEGDQIFLAVDPPLQAEIMQQWLSISTQIHRGVAFDGPVDETLAASLPAATKLWPR